MLTLLVDDEAVVDGAYFGLATLQDSHDAQEEA